MSTVNQKKNQLVNAVKKFPNVKAIGQTGSLEEDLIPGFSDIDMFVLCDRVPDAMERHNAYETCKELYTECNMNVCENCIWGTGDILIVDGIDTMFMFFTIGEMTTYVEEVLAGKHIYAEGEFYPIGRLATIESIDILYEEDGVMSKLKEKVAVYPEELAEVTIHSHLSWAINEEDIGRAYLRKDVLFYHQVLEKGIDHFLQALYAVNRTYFPSRKRSEQYIKNFKKVPKNCYERLLQVIENGARSETILQSIAEYRKLCEELCNIAEHEVEE